MSICGSLPLIVQRDKKKHSTRRVLQCICSDNILKNRQCLSTYSCRMSVCYYAEYEPSRRYFTVNLMDFSKPINVKTTGSVPLDMKLFMYLLNWKYCGPQFWHFNFPIRSQSYHRPRCTIE